MVQELRQSTAVKVKMMGAVAVADGFTPVTNLAVSSADEAELFKHDSSAVTSISGNTWAAISNADGSYNLTLTADNLDTLGMLDITINDDNLVLPLVRHFSVITANAWDSKYSTDKLEVDLLQIGGVAQSATDLKDFADTGYNPTTHKVAGVVLADTTTTNTDMVGTNAAALAETALTNATWTDARAGYLDELASANLPTDVDGLTAAVITNAAGTDVAADIIALKAETVLIVEDTNEMQTDLKNGGRLDALVDLIVADADLARLLLQNRIEFDLDNSRVYVHSDAGARAYSCALTDSGGSAVTASTTGPINRAQWTAV